jgi:hypothetical protein
MAVTPVAAGVTSHSGTLTPEIWSGKTLVKFYTSTVFAEISNTDYEGEIKNAGDTVHIRTIPDITINDYYIGEDLKYERPPTTVVDLLIDKGKSYALAINDVEKLQSDLAYVEKWTDDAGEQLAISIDSGILSDVYADVHASNAGATAGAVSSSLDMGATGAPVSLDKTNVLDYIVDMGTVLDEQDIPQTSRWVVLTALFCGMIKKSDLKDASLAGDGTSILRNGRMGAIDRFTLYSSNQVATTTDGANTAYNCIFGHPAALTFASQLVKNETLKNPWDFGDLLRGLQVYGYKVIKTEAMGHFYAIKG